MSGRGARDVDPGQEVEVLTRHSSASVIAVLVLGLVGYAWGAPGTASAGFSYESSFDDGVFGWAPVTSFSQIYASDLDVVGSPASGSARIEVKTTTPALVGFPHDYRLECFPIDPGLTYQVGGWILIPADQATAGSAQMSVLFYANGSCLGVPELRNTFAVRTPGEWIWAEDPSVVPPLAAQSARLGMAVFKNTADVTFEANFDDVLFAPEPSRATRHAVALAALALLGGLPRAPRVHRSSCLP